MADKKATKRILDFLSNPANEEMLNYVVCDFVNDGISYWAMLDLDDNVYAAAKRQLVELGRKNICFEDVLTQILLNGEALPIMDNECESEVYGDENPEVYNLTLGNLAYGVVMFCEYQREQSIEEIENLSDEDLEELIEELDAADADLIVQYALFDDVIFG